MEKKKNNNDEDGSGMLYEYGSSGETHY